MKIVSSVATAITGTFFMLGLTTAVDAAEVRVASALAMSVALKAVSSEFEKSTGHKLILSFGTAGQVKSRAESGTPSTSSLLRRRQLMTSSSKENSRPAAASMLPKSALALRSAPEHRSLTSARSTRSSARCWLPNRSAVETRRRVERPESTLRASSSNLELKRRWGQNPNFPLVPPLRNSPQRGRQKLPSPKLVKLYPCQAWI